MLISIAISVLVIIATWKVFEKAGKPGWAAIVPFYNQYVQFEITWGDGWRFLMLLIPIYNIVVFVQTCLRTARAFGKSDGFGVGLIFLPFVFYPMLGFDASTTYLGVPVKNTASAQPVQSQPAQQAQQTQPQQPVQPAQQAQDSGFRLTFCPDCGAKVEGSGKFCQHCGKPLQ